MGVTPNHASHVKYWNRWWLGLGISHKKETSKEGTDGWRKIHCFIIILQNDNKLWSHHELTHPYHVVSEIENFRLKRCFRGFLWGRGLVLKFSSHQGLPLAGNFRRCRSLQPKHGWDGDRISPVGWYLGRWSASFISQDVIMVNNG